MPRLGFFSKHYIGKTKHKKQQLAVLAVMSEDADSLITSDSLLYSSMQSFPELACFLRRAWPINHLKHGSEIGVY